MRSCSSSAPGKFVKAADATTRKSFWISAKSRAHSVTSVGERGGQARDPRRHTSGQGCHASARRVKRLFLQGGGPRVCVYETGRCKSADYRIANS